MEGNSLDTLARFFPAGSPGPSTRSVLIDRSSSCVSLPFPLTAFPTCPVASSFSALGGFGLRGRGRQSCMSFSISFTPSMRFPTWVGGGLDEAFLCIGGRKRSLGLVMLRRAAVFQGDLIHR